MHTQSASRTCNLCTHMGLRNQFNALLLLSWNPSWSWARGPAFSFHAGPHKLRSCSWCCKHMTQLGKCLSNEQKRKKWEKGKRNRDSKKGDNQAKRETDKVPSRKDEWIFQDSMLLGKQGGSEKRRSPSRRVWGNYSSLSFSGKSPLQFPGTSKGGSGKR